MLPDLIVETTTAIHVDDFLVGQLITDREKVPCPHPDYWCVKGILGKDDEIPTTVWQEGYIDHAGSHCTRIWMDEDMDAIEAQLFSSGAM